MAWLEIQYRDESVFFPHEGRESPLIMNTHRPMMRGWVPATMEFPVSRITSESGRYSIFWPQLFKKCRHAPWVHAEERLSTSLVQVFQKQVMESQISPQLRMKREGHVQPLAYSHHPLCDAGQYFHSGAGSDD